MADGRAPEFSSLRPGYRNAMAEGGSVSTGVHAALFKVVAIADLKGADEAVAWAQSVLDDEQLLASFAERAVRESQARHTP